MNISFIFLFIPALIIMISGCAALQEKKDYKLPLELKTHYSTSNKQHPILRSGQIVVSESGNDYSLFFALFPERYSPFIHAGILVFVDGEPYVYEGLGSLPIFMGDTPTDAITGKIHRRHLNHYLEVENYTSIYDLPDTIDRSKVVEFALYNHQHETPFDPYMNSLNHEKLYCTEFVLEALKAGGMTQQKLTPYRENKSLKIVHEWLKITDKTVIQAGSLIDPKKHIVTLSHNHSYREIQLYIATREELHRRFTKDQKLGNIFEWTGFRLKFRPSIAQFSDKAILLLKNNEHPSWKATQAAVRKLANEYWGVFTAEKTSQPSGLASNPALPCLNNNSAQTTSC